MASITSPGVGSGLDINTLIAQIIAAEAQPVESRLAQQEARFQTEISGLGSLKSALSTFSASLADLKKVETFKTRTATSGDTKIFTASTTDKAVPGKFNVSVERLAEAHKLASAGVASAATVVGSGALTFTSNGKVFSVTIAPGANTLADIRDAINAAPDNIGVDATIVTVDNGGASQSKLVLTATQTGAVNAVTVSVDDDDGFDADITGLSMLASGNLSTLQGALDAQIMIDGQLATRATNTISDAIDGVTIELIKANVGNAVALTVSRDKAALRALIDGFVGSLNTVLGALDGLGAFDAETGAAGTLLGDATLRTVRSTLRRELTTPVVDPKSTFDTLAEIGIGVQTDGTYSVDSKRFDAAVAASFDGVGQLFAAIDGLAVRLDTALKPFAQSNGLIDSRTTSLTGSITALDSQREALDRRLVSLEQRLITQFTAMDTLVGQLNNTSSFLTQQLSSLQKLTNRPTNGS